MGAQKTPVRPSFFYIVMGDMNSKGNSLVIVRQYKVLLEVVYSAHETSHVGCATVQLSRDLGVAARK